MIQAGDFLKVGLSLSKIRAWDVCMRNAYPVEKLGSFNFLVFEKRSNELEKKHFQPSSRMRERRLRCVCILIRSYSTFGHISHILRFKVRKV